ncbi:MAG: single-stranded-DNA-specific exonuclease RecJ [Phycisphaerae bacterium]
MSKSFAQAEWIIAPPHPQREDLARRANVSTLIAQVALNRAISEPDALHRFLKPQFSELYPPDALPGARDAARLLASAIREKRKVVIYGDYDVDGVTATTILWHTIRRAGGVVDSYVPCRMEEGYGLNADAIRTIAANGASLIITVDCGITAIDETALARELGMQMIISDHHQPRETLPAADAIVHPTACGPSANEDLCGAGVALKIAWALALELSGNGKASADFREWLVDATAFAAVGLISDLVPLLGENRILVHFGLKQLPHVKNVGMQALIDVSGLRDQRNLDDFDIGFKLAPRLNAVGRMGHAELAVELFTTADQHRANEIARTLDRHNRDRQNVERAIVAQAEEMVVANGYHKNGCRGIVLAHADWHPGVIGIVASRLVDRFHRPTVLIALNGESGSGSGRSIQHFPLHEVLGACGNHLLSHGGHAMAAGVRVGLDKIDAFRTAFVAEASNRLTDRDLQPKLRLDDEVPLEEIRADVVDHLARLAPYGQGNARPRLATGDCELQAPPRVVGKSANHLQFTVRQGNEFRKAIAFFAADQCQQLSEQRKIRLAFEPILNEWNGRRTAELKVIDWKPSDET